MAEARPGDPRPSGRLRLPREIPEAVVLAALAGIGLSNFVLRVWMLGRYPVPPSADHGFYLSQAHIFLGTDVAGFGATMPPLLFLILIGLLQVLDPISAVRFLAAFPILLLPYPFYRLVSRHSTRAWALLATFLFVFNEGYSEMAGWGGAPDLFAIAVMLASLGILLRYLENPTRRGLVLASLLASVVVGSHHLTTFMFAGTVGIWGVLEAVRARTHRPLVPFLKFGGLTIAFSLPYLPVYLWDGARLAPQLTPLWPDGLEGVGLSLSFLFRDSMILWATFAVLGVAGSVLLLRRRREGFLYFGLVVVSVVAALTLIRDNAARPLYYLYIPLLATLPAFFTWAFAHRPRDVPERTVRTVRVLLVAFALVSTATVVGQSVGRMSVAVDWYHAVEEDEVAALNWIRANTAPDAVVATAGRAFFDQPEGTRYAWWIEGYAERKSFFAGSVVFAVLAEERQMVRDANLFFAGNYLLVSDGLRIAENHPSSQGNPEISVRVDRGFRPVAYVDDGFAAVDRDPGDGNVSRTVLYPSSGVVSLTSGALPAIETTRVLADLIVTRTEWIAGRSVFLRFEVQVANATVPRFEVPLWIGYGFEVSDLSSLGNRTSLDLVDVRGPTIPLEATTGMDVPGTVETIVTNADPEFGVPRILLRASPSAPTARLTLSLQIAFPEAPLGSGPVLLYDTLAIAASYGVTHVYQTKRLFSMFMRFQNDREHFGLAYDTATVAVYRVQTLGP